MKMIYNGAPIKSLNIKHYEMSTNDATLKASDMQSGITAYAKGKKVIGTGKCFEFANYGGFKTNSDIYVPDDINVIVVSSIDYPIKNAVPLINMYALDFSTSQIIGIVTIDGNDYDLSVTVNDNVLRITCEQTFNLQVFYGKDGYVNEY